MNSKLYSICVVQLLNFSLVVLLTVPTVLSAMYPSSITGVRICTADIVNIAYWCINLDKLRGSAEC